MKTPVALQLYSVRDRLEADFEDTLRAVAQSGYTAVEFYGNIYDRLPASELQALLNSVNLTSVGATISQKMLSDELDRILAYHRRIGSQFLSVGTRCAHAFEWREYAESLNSPGKQCAEKGIRLCYHNHDHELALFDGKTALEILLENTDPKYINLEFDTYWAQYAGTDPLVFMTRFSDRIALMHQKDMKASDKGFCEIGEGIMDIRSLYENAVSLNLAWFILEQDACEGPSLACAARNLKNLRKIVGG